MTDTRRPAIAPTSRRSGRGGFTLVELLVVILIITIVAAIVAVGIFSAYGGQRDKTTRTRLESAATLLAEYRRDTRGGAAAGVTSTAGRLPEKLDRDLNDDGAADADDVMNVADADLTSAGPQPLVTGDPGTVAAGDADNGFAPFGRTRLVMQRLLRVPANRAAADALPTEALFRLPTSAADDAPVLLDGFGNVILYVPSVGLAGLDYGDAFPGWGAASDPRLVARDRKGFFMSAGPDGSYGQAADNSYSTEVYAVHGPNSSGSDEPGTPIL